MKTITMKSNLKFLAIIAFLGLFLHSCSSDDDNGPALNAPVISDFEYGEGSSHSTDKVAYKGSDIHLGADILAENVVASITLDIHGHVEVGEGEEEWHFNRVYNGTNYQAINVHFHEHVDVPANAPAGEYHLKLTVTDALGNSTEVEGHLHVLVPAEAISLSDFHVSSSVQRGDDFHTEFMIQTEHGIHNITVNIHGHGITVGEGETEWHFNEVFSEGYHGQTEIEFHEHIDVPAATPAGEYHITFTVEDEEGNIAKYETHIDVTE